jgi:hypothetical protein
MDVLGSLAQPRGLPHQGCFGSGKGQTPWRHLCDQGNGSRDIFACEPAMYPFVNFSAHFVVGLGAFIIGGASDIRRRSSIKIILWGETTLCSPLGITLCWSCISATAWGTHWKLSSGRIHAWHGLVRKAGPPGYIVPSDNFARTNVSTRCCFLALIAPKVDTVLFVNSCK